MSDIIVIPTPQPVIQVTVSTVGVQGPAGPRGPSGDDGSGSDLSFTWNQSSASAVWTINHPLGKFPSVTIVDSAGSEIEGDIQYVSSSQIIATFSAAFAGVAYLN